MTKTFLLKPRTNAEQQNDRRKSSHVPLELRPEECNSLSKNHPGRLVGRCHTPAKPSCTESHPRLPLLPTLFFTYNPVLQNLLLPSIPRNLPNHSIRIDPAPDKSVQKQGVQHGLPCLLIDILEEACTGLFRDSAAGLVSGTQSPYALEGTCGCDDPASIA